MSDTVINSLLIACSALLVTSDCPSSVQKTIYVCLHVGSVSIERMGRVSLESVQNPCKYQSSGRNSVLKRCISWKIISNDYSLVLKKVGSIKICSMNIPAYHDSSADIIKLWNWINVLTAKSKWPDSDNLRWHMVYQVKMQGKSCRKVGKTLSVDPSTVSRTWILSMLLATLTSESYPSPNLAQMCLKSWWLFLKQFLKTEVLLHELQQTLLFP